MMGREDHWTSPTAWQEHPEWWTADDDDADAAEYEVRGLVRALIRCLQPRVVVETGTATGKTARMIGETLQRNGHGWLWTVEIDPATALLANTAVEGLPVTVVCADTADWWPPQLIDFAWIDSGPAAVRVGEIIRWRQVFTAGAIIGVHDTAPNMGREVLCDRLHAFADQAGWPMLNLRTPRGVSLIQVPVWP